MVDNSLIAPCGLYCGTCRQYLVLKKNLFEEKGLKMGCKGCRIRNKNCAFIKRDCPPIRKNEYEYCFECEEFPCHNLERLDTLYQNKYSISLTDNLRRLKEVGVEKWLIEQKSFYTCSQCQGEICVHDAECFDCGSKMKLNVKKQIYEVKK